jgi:hypothetical protein
LAAPDHQGLERPVPTNGVDQTPEHDQAYIEPGVISRDRLGGIMEPAKTGTPSAAALTLIVLVWSAAALADTGLNMKPGLWEIVTTTQGHVAGTERKCYLPKDVTDLQSQMRGQLVLPNQPCKFTDYKQMGNTVTYTMTCTFGKGKPVRSTVTATYSGDSTHGTVTSASGVQSAIDSRRIDTCAKSSF